MSPYALEAVKMMKEAGIISGRPGNIFVPLDSATRAEGAKVIAAFLSAIIRR
ncbi:MAG TPA: S-layer homology domain-containing protein [Clostridiaceae bacterium]|nr:S-layer homology domain-containing protein [Clostridiaceae bacterium]